MFATAYMGRKRCFRIMLLLQYRLFSREQLRLRARKGVRRGYAPPFSSQVRSGERGAPVRTCNARRENRRLLAQLPLLP
jgi:hypothetical protein